MYWWKNDCSERNGTWNYWHPLIYIFIGFIGIIELFSTSITILFGLLVAHIPILMGKLVNHVLTYYTHLNNLLLKIVYPCDSFGIQWGAAMSVGCWSIVPFFFAYKCFLISSLWGRTYPSIYADQFMTTPLLQCSLSPVFVLLFVKIEKATVEKALTLIF